MAIEVKMPALAPSIEELTLVRWTRKVGDAVKAGDVIAEVETDKALVELEASDAGIIGKFVGQLVERKRAAASDVGALPPRPPNFCTGCPERPVFGALHYFDPDALALAMRGEYDATAVATTEEVEADHE